MEKKKIPPTLKVSGMVCPIGGYGAEYAPSLTAITSAARFILKLMYSGISLPEHIRLHKRDKLIRERYEAGESQADLARRFGISYQRVHQILHGTMN